MRTVYSNKGDTVDLICWQNYGRTAGVTEAVLAANPGLAELGVTLPHGHAIVLPDAPNNADTTRRVALWD